MASTSPRRLESIDTRSVRRGRSGSVLSVEEIKPSYDENLDKGIATDSNANWVNLKGAWSIHVVLLVVAAVFLDILRLRPAYMWTLLNVGYVVITYAIFHLSKGVPFDDESGGASARLTLWEQMDNGAHFTPAKKWLMSVPVVVFLIGTHYASYDENSRLFSLNILALVLIGLAPKLPYFHRLRFHFFQSDVGHSEPPTPIAGHKVHSL